MSDASEQIIEPGDQILVPEEILVVFPENMDFSSVDTLIVAFSPG